MDNGSFSTLLIAEKMAGSPSHLSLSSKAQEQASVRVACGSGSEYMGCVFLNGQQPL